MVLAGRIVDWWSALLRKILFGWLRSRFTVRRLNTLDIPFTSSAITTLYFKLCHIFHIGLPANGLLSFPPSRTRIRKYVICAVDEALSILRIPVSWGHNFEFAYSLRQSPKWFPSPRFSNKYFMNLRFISNLLHIPDYHHKNPRCCVLIMKIFIAHFYPPYPCNSPSPTFFLWSEYLPQAPAIGIFSTGLSKEPLTMQFLLDATTSALNDISGTLNWYVANCSDRYRKL